MQAIKKLGIIKRQLLVSWQSAREFEKIIDFWNPTQEQLREIHQVVKAGKSRIPTDSRD